MKFFTRELFDLARPDAPLSIAENAWAAANRAHRIHFTKIFGQIPRGLNDLTGSSMSGAIVLSVDHIANGTIVLELDAKRPQFAHRGIHRLTFEGVRASSGLDTATGAMWLAVEADIHPDAAFELCVLTEMGEFFIAADSLRSELVQKVENAGNPCPYCGEIVLEAKDVAATANFYSLLGLPSQPHDSIAGAYKFTGNVPRITISPATGDYNASAPHLILTVPSVQRLFESLPAAPDSIIARSESPTPNLTVLAPGGLILEFVEYTGTP